MQKIRVEAEMSSGTPPDAVRIEVSQGAHVLRSADVSPQHPGETFDVDDGDYLASAVSLVPYGTEATAVFAVPMRVTVSPG